MQVEQEIWRMDYTASKLNLRDHERISSWLVCLDEGGMGAVLPLAPTPSTNLTLRPPSQFCPVFSRMTKLLREEGNGWLFFLAERDMGRGLFGSPLSTLLPRPLQGGAHHGFKGDGESPRINWRLPSNVCRCDLVCLEGGAGRAPEFL